MNKVSLSVDKLEAFGEATLAKELALQISTNAYLSILLLEFFFHNHLLGRGSRRASLLAALSGK